LKPVEQIVKSFGKKMEVAEDEKPAAVDEELEGGDENEDQEATDDNYKKQAEEATADLTKSD
jgi:hypothetical protein